MTRKEALESLLAKVEAGGDVYGFGAVGEPLVRGYAAAAYNGSLDAAKALHDAVLPGWHFDVATDASGLGFYSCVSTATEMRKVYLGGSDNPSRAWLIAILKALIAQEAK